MAFSKYFITQKLILHRILLAFSILNQFNSLLNLGNFYILIQQQATKKLNNPAHQNDKYLSIPTPQNKFLRPSRNYLIPERKLLGRTPRPSLDFLLPFVTASQKAETRGNCGWLYMETSPATFPPSATSEVACRYSAAVIIVREIYRPVFLAEHETVRIKMMEMLVRDWERLI